MTQWHPIFDHLLRKALQDYYEVQTNVPVGDLPREADIVLVRRATGRKPPFRTLWKNLSRWNVLEFKGRSESARVADVDLLVEVGLGIHRRLSEQDPKVKIARSELSFWYLANHLGARFLRDVVELTGELDNAGTGLWRGRILGRPLWLVSNRDVPIDEESAPVSIVSEQSVDRAFELARIAVLSDELWQTYGPLLDALFPHQRKEFDDMATKQRRKKDDWEIFMRNLIDAAGPQTLAKSGAAQKIFDTIGPDGFLALLTPKQRRELTARTEAEAAQTVIDKIGLDGLLAVLTPEQRRELAKRMEAGKK